MAEETKDYLHVQYLGVVNGTMGVLTRRQKIKTP